MAATRIGIAAVVLALAADARAVNLVANPGFDDDLGGWTNPFTVDPGPDQLLPTRGGEDVAGSPTSGSARLTNASTVADRSLYIEQCVEVVPGAPFEIGGFLYVESGQVEGLAGVDGQWFEDPNCTVPTLVSTGFSNFTTTDAWHYRFLFKSSPPPTAQSVSVRLVAWKVPAGGTFIVSFDDVALLPEAGLGELAAGAALGLLAARTRRAALASRAKTG
jgi:hypothetical protein